MIRETHCTFTLPSPRYLHLKPMILGHTLFEQEFETNKDKKVKKSKSKIKIKKEMVANMTENTSNCSKSSLTSG